MFCPSGPIAFLIILVATAEAESSGDVEELHITAPLSERAAPAETWNTVPAARVHRSDARSAADVLRRAPGALVQTNSRGQTLVVLRNSGEREVTVFFDGAPLEIPWDHRIDLRLMPAAAVGRTEVARGPLSNRYGPNISGGAIFLEPPESPRERAATLRTEGGTAGHFRFEASASVSLTEEFSLLVAVERTEWSGEPLADALAFSQADDELRTNTDARRTSVLARAAWAVARIELTLSVLYGGAVLGVAPEAHLDPTVERVRFWRYPDTHLAMVIAGMQTGGRGWAADTIVWGQAFDQTIDSFGSVRFNRLSQRQVDTDLSLGSRARLAGTFGEHRLSISAYGTMSSHDELRVNAMDTAARSVEEERFVHALWSAGADYLLTGKGLRLRVGAGVDGLEPLETADRPSAGGIRGWNASAGGRVDLTSTVFLRGAIGSRARLPTPRELYGTALDRFVLNDSLRAERTTSVEVGVTYAGPQARLELVPFASWTDDTLDQENVVIDGTTFRRRVNLDGSRVFGLEIIADVDLASWLHCAGQLLISDVRPVGMREGRITERPSVQGFAELVIGRDESFELATEVVARSESTSLAPEGQREVSGAGVFNVRAAYRISDPTLGDLELYGRIDNIFNARLEPQLGLPEPGRWFRFGLALRL